MRRLVASIALVAVVAACTPKSAVFPYHGKSVRFYHVNPLAMNDETNACAHNPTEAELPENKADCDNAQIAVLSGG